MLLQTLDEKVFIRREVRSVQDMEHHSCGLSVPRRSKPYGLRLSLVCKIEMIKRYHACPFLDVFRRYDIEGPRQLIVVAVDYKPPERDVWVCFQVRPLQDTDMARASFKVFEDVAPDVEQVAEWPRHAIFSQLCPLVTLLTVPFPGELLACARTVQGNPTASAAFGVPESGVSFGTLAITALQLVIAIQSVIVTLVGVDVLRA